MLASRRFKRTKVVEPRKQNVGGIRPVKRLAAVVGLVMLLVAFCVWGFLLAKGTDLTAQENNDLTPQQQAQANKPKKDKDFSQLVLEVPTGAESLKVGLGLTVRDGKVYKDGKPYRAFGMNVRDLADEILDLGEGAKDSFACIRYLGEKKVSFIRFWASYFNNWKKYIENPEKYWRHMDLLVDACEKANVALAPTLFWCDWDVPWVFGEYRCDWADEDSQTRQFMERYTREFVTRYRNRPIVWLYEFSNENNLAWDLPNAMQFLPEKHSDARNIARFYVGRIAIRSFAWEVRKHDPYRSISSGCSEPRGCQFHLATVPPGGNPWADDTAEQAAIAAGWMAPDPVNLCSMHYYTSFAGYDSDKVRAEIKSLQETAARVGKPLYIGEFGVLDDDGKIGDDFNDALYKERLRDLFEALYQAKVPLAAYWVYAVKPWGFGMGAVNPEFKRFDYIIDFIREYNEKIAGDMAAEGNSVGGR